MQTKKFLGLGIALASSAAAVAITLNYGSGFLVRTANADLNYTLTLDSTNGISGTNVTTTQTVQTDSGKYDVEFSYTNVSSLSGGHCTILENGVVVNADHIRSISEIKAVFSTSGTLNFRTSYDGATWGAYNAMVSNQAYTLASNPYYIELSAANGSVDLTSMKFSYTCQENPDAAGTEIEGSTVFKLVTQESEIVVGDTYTFVSVDDGAGYAASTTILKSYYLTPVSITVSDGQFDYDSSLGFVLGGSSGAYTFTKEGGNSTPLYDGNTYQSLYFLEADSQYTTWNINIANHQIYSNNSTQNPHYIVYNSSKGSWNSYQNGSNTATYLFHKVTESGGTQYDVPVDETGFTATDSNANSYNEASIFDSANSLVVKATFSDGTSTVLSKGGDNGYSYTIKDSDNNVINTAEAFGAEGVYTLTVSYKSYIPVVINLNVGVSVVLTGISASMVTTTYNTADILGNNLTGNLTADLTYNHSTYNQTGVAYANFASNNVAVKLINSSDVEVNLNNVFGTAGTYTLRVYSTEDATVHSDISITVAAIPVTDVTLDQSEMVIQVGRTGQLVATVSPSTATNASVVWTSSDESIATVSESGLVTGVAVGSCTITATSVDDGTIYGTCAVTVKKNTTTTATITCNNTATSNSSITASTDLFNTSGITLSSASGSSLFGGPDTSIKFSSGNNSGSLTFTFSEAVVITGVSIKAAYYDASASVLVTTSANTTGQSVSLTSSSASDYAYTAFADDTVESTTLTISSAKKNRFYLYSVTLTVGTTDPVFPTAISLTGTSSIAIGETSQLSVNYSPVDTNQKNVTFASSNTSVATVSSDGLVTGVAAGNATITATAETEDDYTSATFDVSVHTVAVTGISLSASTAEIGIGQEKVVSASVLPSNATNKNVTWSTSNSSIATVSNGTITGVAVGSCTVTATTVDGGYSASVAVTVVEQAIDEWTIMIYMCGADLESENSLATGDIEEILSVSGQPDNVNIIIETGGANTTNSYFSKTALQRWHVENESMVLDKTLTKASMGLTATFQSFLEWGLTEYPAQKTGVIMWNHGGGMYGCCYDELYSDNSILNSEAKSAFAGAFSSTGRTEKLEWIGYDCCLMQVQDIADFNSNYFNYMVASEESEAGYGWDYDTWVDDLYALKPSTTIFKSIVDGFITDNGGTSSSSNDQTLSYLNLSYMSAYRTAFESFASALSSKVGSSYTSFASWVVSNVKHYADSDYTYFCLWDVKDFVNKVAANSTYNPGSSYTSAVLTAFSNLVEYSSCGKGAGNSYGLCLFYSATSTDSSYAKSAYTSSQTNFTNWLSFNQNCGYLG